jgi:hypothetical protein
METKYYIDLHIKTPEGFETNAKCPVCAILVVIA